MQIAQSFASRHSLKLFSQPNTGRSFARTLTKAKKATTIKNVETGSVGSGLENFISERREEIVKITEDDLTPIQAWCLFNEGYERAFSGNLHDFEEIGTYHCGACDSELFTSD